MTSEHCRSIYTTEWTNEMIKGVTSASFHHPVGEWLKVEFTVGNLATSCPELMIIGEPTWEGSLIKEWVGVELICRR